jgi:hypothetical protein
MDLMRLKIGRSLVLVVLAVVCVHVAPVRAASGLLDGKTFKGETGKVAEQGDPEVFVFASGEFDPIACHEWGFYATPYTVTEENDGEIHFVAEHTNQDGDRMRWEGVVDGDLLKGSMWYWHGDDRPEEYWFEADLEER